MSAAKVVKAKFEPKPKLKLAVTKSGAGSGTVTSSPGGINCGGDCEEEYPEGEVVALTPTPSSGSKFVEWTGACTGAGACNVTMSAAETVNAQFATIPKEEPPKEGQAKVTGVAGIKAGKAALKLTCSGGPCKGTLKLTAKVKMGHKTKSVVIGKAPFSLAEGTSLTLKVSLSGPAKQELAKGKTLQAKGAGTGVANFAVKLKPAKKK
jgi:hypothetical protein